MLAKEATPLTLDSLIRGLAGNENPVLSYATTDDHFINFTGSDIERLTTIGANIYLQAFKALNNFPNNPDKSSTVVALVGTSTLEYYITFLSIQRLGFTTLLLSPRLAEQSYAHLLHVTGCHTLVAPESHRRTFEEITHLSDGATLGVIPMIEDVLTLEDSATGKDAFSPLPELECHSLDQTPGVIVHSGGTTSGLPKPISAPSGAWIAAVGGSDAKNHRLHTLPTLNTLPLYHTFGLGVLFRAIRMGTRLSVLNAGRPLVASAVYKALDATGSRSLTTVPYVLKFLAEEKGGVERLAKLDFVSVGGAAVPDDLGQLLLDACVNLKTTYGQSESGILMVPAVDKDRKWGWLEPMPHAEPYMKFEQVEGDLYHLIILPGLESKTLTDRPDGSYGTKDLFRKHPEKPRRWKFVARYDDIIVLSNGENADPVPLENALMNNPNVAMAVAFGAGQESLGVIVIPSQNVSTMSHLEFLESIKPDLELGNSRVAAFARVSLDAVLIQSPDTPLPMTGKSTLQRALFYRQFATVIEDYYAQGGAHAAVDSSRKQPLNDAEVGRIIEEVVFHHHPPLKFQSDADFFAHGMDSLQASRIRTEIIRRLSIKAEKLATNVVFNHPNLRLLTQHILDVHNGRQDSTRNDPEEIARGLIKKYTTFSAKERDCKDSIVPSPWSSVILLTGATGYLGVQILHNLVSRQEKTRVYCLVRAKDKADAESRLDQAFVNSKLTLPKTNRKRAIALAGDLGSEKLGLDPGDYEALRSSVTAIIHNAWTVNFNMTLSSFEPQLAGTRRLIDLALSSGQKHTPELVFISSIAAVAAAGSSSSSSLNPYGELSSVTIMEHRYGWGAVGSLGYGQSKWAAEEICYAASKYAGLPIKVVRLGQISGDSEHGTWNPSEAVPTMVMSALSVGALPRVEAESVFRVGDAQLWIPSDVAAASIVELALSKLGEDAYYDAPSPENTEVSANSDGPWVSDKVPYSIFHVAGTCPASWNTEILLWLRRHGMVFEIISQRDWVDRLAASNPDVSRNPPYKLLEYFKRQTNPDHTLQVSHPEQLPVQVRLDTTRALQCAPSLATAPRLDEELMGKYLRYWQQESWQPLEKELSRARHGKEMGYA
ncbi:hypothetical protein FDECE_8699 [Fusarium decemcellulare]|nr:hypothetical protein FDECE_8699 [Fusarium decemcellulare]